MDLGSPASLNHWNASEALSPGDSLDKGVEPPEEFFCHNASEKLPPEDLDLEKQCTVPGDTKPSWWRRIWGRIFSLIFKSEETAALPRADSDLSSTPNTSVNANRPTIETVRQTNFVEPAATYPDLPTFDKTIRIHSRPPSPPPPSDTLEDPRQHGVLSHSELAELISFIESGDCVSPRISSFDRSTARQRDSATIPLHMYQPHPEVCK